MNDSVDPPIEIAVDQMEYRRRLKKHPYWVLALKRYLILALAVILIGSLSSVAYNHFRSYQEKARREQAAQRELEATRESRHQLLDTRVAEMLDELGAGKLQGEVDLNTTLLTALNASKLVASKGRDVTVDKHGYLVQLTGIVRSEGKHRSFELLCVPCPKEIWVGAELIDVISIDDLKPVSIEIGGESWWLVDEFETWGSEPR